MSVPAAEPLPSLALSATGSASASQALLDVDRSVTGRRWTLVPACDRLAATLAQRHALPEIVGRVLAARGVGLDDAESFLDPTLRRLLPDPCVLKDMRAGAARLAAAVTAGEIIAVFGDYDVDGATSAALLLRFLAAVGAEPPLLYVPDRLREGYGPNSAALLALRRKGVAVVVTVDCGIAAFEPLEAAAQAGLDVVVVDHHQGRETLPVARAVVNPNRLDESGALGNLAAVGVTFLLTVDTNRLLREAGWYATRPEPDLRLWLDLVALGTVCDVVPLTGLNRAFVTQGLKVMARRGNLGLRALADIAGLTAAPTCRDLGFGIGPRINAGGRVGASELGARLLSCDDQVTAATLAAKLDALNRERQALELAVLDAACTSLPPPRDAAPLIWAAGSEWHPGVIGIVASRLAERFRRPAIVVAITGDRAVASGRSVPGLDLGAAVNAAVQAGLLLKGGGHPMAAGFTAETAQLGSLQTFLAERLAYDAAAEDRLRILSLDGVLTLPGAAALNPAVLAALAPFGSGHPEPRFALPDVRLIQVRRVGSSHLACVLADGASRLPAIAFGCIDQSLGSALSAHAGALLHLAGRLQAARGGGLQFVIEDAAVAFGCAA